jgi:hypothetical protein
MNPPDGSMNDPNDFDAEHLVRVYRAAIAQHDDATAMHLHRAWAARQGEDNLHEMAFGKSGGRNSRKRP